MFGAAESVQIDEYGVILDLTGVFHAEVVRVGEHGHDLLFDLVRVLAQIDAVAERLAHLGLAVDAGQAQAGLVVREQHLGLDQRVPVNRIEFADDFLGLLQHRGLIFAHGHGRCLEGRDVGRLADRVGEETDRDAGFKVAHLDFGFHCGVALEPGHGHKVHIVEREFAEFGDLRLDEHRGFYRIKAAGEIVEGDFDDVLAHLFGMLGVVCQRLRIRDHDENLVVLAGVLELHPALQRTDIVADMQSSGGPISSQYNLFHYSFPFACFVFFG